MIVSEYEIKNAMRLSHNAGYQRALEDLGMSPEYEYELKLKEDSVPDVRPVAKFFSCYGLSNSLYGGLK